MNIQKLEKYLRGNLLKSGVAIIMLFSIYTSNAQDIVIHPPELIKVSIDINTGFRHVYFEQSIDSLKISHYRVGFPRDDGWGTDNEGNRVRVISIDTFPLIFNLNDQFEFIDATKFSTDTVYAYSTYSYTLNDSINKSYESSYVSLSREIMDTAMILNGQFDKCGASIRLNWNTYNTWERPNGGIREYRVYSRRNGTNTLEATLPPGSNSYETRRLQNGILQDNDTIQLFIAAIRDKNNRVDSATTNMVSNAIKMPRVPEYIYINYVTKNADAIDISFSADPNTQLNEYLILRSVSPNNMFDTISKINRPNGGEINYTDDINYLNGPYYYKILALSSCGQVIDSSTNLGSTILLHTELEENTPLISWNNYTNWYQTDAQYQVLRYFPENESETTPIFEGILNSYHDEEIAGLKDVPAKVCYTVRSNPVSNSSQLSLSNSECIVLPVNIEFEYDGFIPGNEEVFKPTFTHYPEVYSFKILDRGGRTIFSVDEPTEGWDGTFNGQTVFTGAYLCVIEYRVTKDSKKKTITHGIVVKAP